MELIERLGKAQGPDRRLDAEIAAALGQSVTYSEEIVPKPCGDDGNYLPYYTASLDAAMTLVPDNWMVRILGQNDGGGWFAELVSRFPSSYDRSTRQEGFWDNSRFSAPLALCIAALRART